MSFYSNFLSLCNSVNKTPSRVVLDVGLKKPAVTRWKAGSLPTDASAMKLAEYFGVTVAELMADHEKKPAPVSGSELDIEAMINNMSREDLISFIMAASSRLQDLEK